MRGAHVVDIFDHGEHDGVPFIAMEYLDGEDLEERLRRLGRLDGESTYRVIAQVSRALSRAHSLGIVHRDLKPENIFLVQGDEHEIAKVLDFGIAKHDTYSLRDKATKTGSFLGTPYYVSPEQARGKAIDYRSDLWSLGVITFQCLTGRPPFESEALGELMGLILTKTCRSRPRGTRSYRPPWTSGGSEPHRAIQSNGSSPRKSSPIAWRPRSGSSNCSRFLIFLPAGRTRASPI